MKYIISFPTLFKSVIESLYLPSNTSNNNDEDDNEKESIILAPIKPVPPPKIVNIEEEKLLLYDYNQNNPIKSPKRKGSIINPNKDCIKVTQFKVLDMNHYICGLKVYKILIIIFYQ